MKLEKGKKYDYPSGLGGRFDVRYVKYDKDRKSYVFKVISPGFEGMELTLNTNCLKNLRPC